MQWCAYGEFLRPVFIRKMRAARFRPVF